MRAVQGILLAAFVALLAGVGAWASAGSGGPDRAVAQAEPPRASGPEAAHRTAVERLSIKQLVGQRVIVSYDGREPPQRLFKMIRGGLVAGVIFFGANTGFVPPSFDTQRAHLRDLIRRMQTARRQAGPKILRRPLLMMTDQEGGLVRRLGGAPSNSEREIGRASNGGSQQTTGRVKLV